jgi:ATP phosphoribosyltransferase
MTLILALPSKGRMADPAFAFFADAGMALLQNGSGREYTARLSGVPDVEVLLLSASEIAHTLISGKAHLGVTGEDLIRETAGDRPAPVQLVKALGFGRADVVAAVPSAWIDVDTMGDLDDVALAFHARHGRRMRVATKYLHLTREFFARAGIRDYRIVESLGATEGAPAAGTAELIVDITSTGATLSANQLKTLGDGTILRSQAQLTASLSAPWTAPAKAAAKHILDRIAARSDAKGTLILRVRMDRGVDAALPRLAAEFGCRIATKPPVDAVHSEAVVLAPKDRVYQVVEALRAAGATAEVTAQTSEYVFSARNALFEGLVAALS